MNEPLVTNHAVALRNSRFMRGSLAAFLLATVCSKAVAQYTPVAPVTPFTPIAPIVQPGEVTLPPLRTPERSKATMRYQPSQPSDESSSRNPIRRQRELELPDPLETRRQRDYEEVAPPRFPSIGTAQTHSPEPTVRQIQAEPSHEAGFGHGREIMSRLEKQVDDSLKSERVQMNRLHRQLKELKEVMKERRAVSAVPVPAPNSQDDGQPPEAITTIPRSPQSPDFSPTPPSPLETMPPPEPRLPSRPTPEPPSPLSINSHLPPPEPIQPTPPAPAPAPTPPTAPQSFIPNGSVGTGASVDRLAMADSLYAANNLPFALQIYREIAPTADDDQRVWIDYQIANSLRRLDQPDDAEKFYREVASRESPAWVVESARWWLSNRTQQKDIDARLKKINEALNVPTQTGAGR